MVNCANFLGIVVNLVDSAQIVRNFNEKCINCIFLFYEVCVIWGVSLGTACSIETCQVDHLTTLLGFSVLDQLIPTNCWFCQCCFCFNKFVYDITCITTVCIVFDITWHFFSLSWDCTCWVKFQKLLELRWSLILALCLSCTPTASLIMLTLR